MTRAAVVLNYTVIYSYVPSFISLFTKAQKYFYTKHWDQIDFPI